MPSKVKRVSATEHADAWRASLGMEACQACHARCCDRAAVSIALLQSTQMPRELLQSIPVF